MEKLSFKREWIFWLLLLVPIVYVAWVWNTLPEKVPIHFGTDGKANGWADKLPGALMVPLVTIGVYLLLLLLPLVDPKGANYDFFKNNYFKIRLLITTCLSALMMEWIYRISSGNLAMDGRGVATVAFVFFALLGNFMINIKPNWFLGVRTPWTLSSDYVWRKTHQVIGRMYFYGGLICLMLNLFITIPGFEVALILTLALAPSIFAVGYSYWLFKQEKQLKQQ